MTTRTRDIFGTITNLCKVTVINKTITNGHFNQQLCVNIGVENNDINRNVVNYTYYSVKQLGFCQGFQTKLMEHPQ